MESLYAVVYRRDTRWDIYPMEEETSQEIVLAHSEKEAARKVSEARVAPPVIVSVDLVKA